jgi:hypothetical protein
VYRKLDREQEFNFSIIRELYWQEYAELHIQKNKMVHGRTWKEEENFSSIGNHAPDTAFSWQNVFEVLPNKIPIDLTFALQQSRAIAQLNIILTQTDPMLVAESFQVRRM